MQAPYLNADGNDISRSKYCRLRYCMTQYRPNLSTPIKPTTLSVKLQLLWIVCNARRTFLTPITHDVFRLKLPQWKNYRNLFVSLQVPQYLSATNKPASPVFSGPHAYMCRDSFYSVFNLTITPVRRMNGCLSCYGSRDSQFDRRIARIGSVAVWLLVLLVKVKKILSN